jgi:hypothetical protein
MSDPKKQQNHLATVSWSNGSLKEPLLNAIFNNDFGTEPLLKAVFNNGSFKEPLLNGFVAFWSYGSLF